MTSALPTRSHWRFRAWCPPFLLAVAAWAAYGRTFSYPFVYDDFRAVPLNLSLARFTTAWHPPAESTVSGRPVLNLSLAADHWIGGNAVATYRITNLAIHWGAALLLAGIIRHALDRRRYRGANALSWGIALIWLVHPLQTAAVTYLAQRAETLVTLFYLLTLYAFARGCSGWSATSGRASPRSHQNVWLIASVAACALGMGTKEVMVSAPVIVLLFDGIFFAGSFRSAWRQRAGYYVSLTLTWAVLIALVLSTHGRSGSVGFGHGVPAGRYLITQGRAICLYVRLSLFPYPLVFDHGKAWADPTPLSLAFGGLVLVALAGTLWALVRRPAIGFLGAAFFALLAPTSSFIPVITEPVAEHRMYLPLACLLIAAVLGLAAWRKAVAVTCCGLAAAALLPVTIARNAVYRSEESIWRDTVRKAPGNERAHYNLGCVLAAQPAGRAEAIDQFTAAIGLDPNYPEARYNLGLALQTIAGREAEAIAQYRAALRLRPDLAPVYCNLGTLLAADPASFPEAIQLFQMAIRLDPQLAEAHFDLAVAWLQSPGREADGLRELRTVLSLDPADQSARDLLARSTAQPRPRSIDMSPPAQTGTPFSPGPD